MEWQKEIWLYPKRPSFFGKITETHRRRHCRQRFALTQIRQHPKRIARHPAQRHQRYHFKTDDRRGQQKMVSGSRKTKQKNTQRLCVCRLCSDILTFLKVYINGLLFYESFIKQQPIYTVSVRSCTTPRPASTDLYFSQLIPLSQILTDISPVSSVVCCLVSEN